MKTFNDLVEERKQEIMFNLKKLEKLDNPKPDTAVDMEQRYYVQLDNIEKYTEFYIAYLCNEITERLYNNPQHKTEIIQNLGWIGFNGSEEIYNTILSKNLTLIPKEEIRQKIWSSIPGIPRDLMKEDEFKNIETQYLEIKDNPTISNEIKANKLYEYLRASILAGKNSGANNFYRIYETDSELLNRANSIHKLDSFSL